MGRDLMYVPGAMTGADLERLSPRQKEALRKAARAQELRRKGYTQREIMAELNVSKRTATRYCQIDLNASILQMLAKEQERRAGIIDVAPPPIKIAENLDIIKFTEDKAHLSFKLNPMQKLILKAFYSLEMDEAELEIMHKLQEEGKTTWKEGEKYRELVVVAGMKGGKTILASVIACWEEYEVYKVGDPSKHWGFPAGERIFIINVATSGEQAEDTIYAQTLARIKNSPFYNLRPYEERGGTIWFKDNGLRIRCGHSNSASIVGKLAKLVLFDELARFKDKGGKSSAEAVYTSLTRSVEPFGEDGKIVSISSPMWEKDKIMSLYRLSSEIENMLGFKLATWEMNPKLPRTHFDVEFKKSLEAAQRDFGADPSHGTEAYYRIPERVDDTFDKCKVNESPVNPDGTLKEWLKGKSEFDYYMHGDPAARNDAFGLALAHREGNKYILDLSYRFESGIEEIDILEVRNLILEIIRRGFNLKKITFDTWGAIVVWQAVRAAGVEPENLYVLKEQHDELKTAIYQGTLEGHFPQELRDELKELVLKKGMKVDHRSSGSKDMADAVAAVIWHCAQEEDLELASGGKEPEKERTRGITDELGIIDSEYGIMGQRRRGFRMITKRRL